MPSIKDVQDLTAPPGSRVIPITKWKDYHPWPSEGSIRYMFFQNKYGFRECVVKCGRRILLNEAKFYVWMQRHGTVLLPVIMRKKREPPAPEPHEAGVNAPTFANGGFAIEDERPGEDPPRRVFIGGVLHEFEQPDTLERRVTELDTAVRLSQEVARETIGTLEKRVTELDTPPGEAIRHRR
jgi:hypothetical protein